MDRIAAAVENLGRFITNTPRELLVLTLGAWAAGISVYLAVGLLGLSGHFGWIQLPGGLAIFANPIIFSLAFIVFSIEFIADKIPYVDSMWDSVHTVIRPLGGFGIGYLAGTEHGPMIQTIYMMLAGTMTLNMHTAKAAGRLAINTSPEPFSNIAASTAEQSLVVAMFWFFIQHPVIAVIVIIGILILAFLIIRMLWRFVKKLFGSGGSPSKS
ncbi:MAG: hypothetical protein BWY42_00198 [Candidatus Omnitrophica bacterium ADurb.Bin277]|nr:MAG: hypothetical protein BWY42_00198 [Candidatus Omnitrophica bacterium ADurb.Bin277]